MSSQRIVVVGASAGGVEALLELARSIPRNFGAPIFAVIHISSSSPSILPSLLTRAGNLPAQHGEDGERYKSGTMYIAPPDHHMLLHRNGTTRVVRGPRENRHRPAIDPLFRSAAVAGGNRTIGVILTGGLDDGTAGLIAIKQSGGIAIVQDPADAMHASMPQNAVENADVDYVLPLRAIADKLGELVGNEFPVAVPSPSLELMDMENRITELDGNTLQEDCRPGKPSAFSCPDCGGVLWEIDDGNYARFRCRVGHALSPESMLSAQSDVLETALWSALKTLEESARLSKRLAEAERLRGHTWMAERFEERENDARARAESIRKALLTGTSEVPQDTEKEHAARARQR